MKQYRVRYKRHKRSQGGFSLVELLVALVISTAVGATIFAALDTSRSKGEILFKEMSSVAGAAKKFAVDTGCYPYQTGMLYNKTLVNGSTNNSCGENVYAAWHGPYGNSMPTNSNGDIQVPSAGVDVYLTITSGNWIPGGASTQYAVKSNSVPTKIAKQAFQSCVGAGSTSTSGSFTVGGSCFLGTPSGGTNTFGYVFAGDS